MEDESALTGEGIGQLEVNVGRPLLPDGWYPGFQEWLGSTAPVGTQVAWWKTPGVVYATGSQLRDAGWLRHDGAGGRNAQEQAGALLDVVTQKRLGTAALQSRPVSLQLMFVGRSRNDPRVLEIKLQGNDRGVTYPEPRLINKERNTVKEAFGLEAKFRRSTLFRVRVAEIIFPDKERAEVTRIGSLPPTGILPEVAKLGPVGVVRQDLSYLLVRADEPGYSPTEGADSNR